MEVEKSIDIDLRSVLKAVMLLSVLTPLIVFPGSIYPTVFGKVAFIRIIAAASWTLFTFLLFMEKGRAFLDIAFLKSKIFWALLAFILSGAVSTIFAVSRYRAFYGDVERGEGLIQFLFLLSILVVALFVFERKNWMSFFKLNLLVGNVIAIDAVIDFFRVHTRPNGSFVGNPAFMSAYLIFVLFAASVVILGNKNSRWRYIGYAAMVSAIPALAVANTRGAFVGVFVGVIALLVYLIVRAGKVRLKRLRDISLRSLSVWILVFIASFSLFFVFTRHSPFWDRVVVFNRLSEISLDDSTVKSRLRSFNITMDAVNPSENGIGRLFIGWGPEHYTYAFNAYYDPSVQATEELKQFDHAHNKLLDVLVMQGVLGLLAYLALWFFVLKAALKKRDSNSMLIGAPIIFFATAYFVQNLFVFDQPVVHIPIFFFLGYVIALDSNGDRPQVNPSSFLKKLLGPISIVVTALLLLGVIYTVFIPARQMSKLISTLNSGYLVNTYRELPAITQPYTYAQQEIRVNLIRAASRLSHVEGARPFLEETIRLGEGVLEREVVIEPEQYQAVALAYDGLAEISGDRRYMSLAEDNYRKALSLAPKRQDQLFVLAMHLIRSGNIDEAVSIAHSILDVRSDSDMGKFLNSVILSPRRGKEGEEALLTLKNLFMDRVVLYEPQEALVRDGYDSYLRHFFDIRDSEEFLYTLERALEIEKTLDAVRDFQVKAGLTGQMESRTEDIRDAIDSFKRESWPAVE